MPDTTPMHDRMDDGLAAVSEEQPLNKQSKPTTPAPAASKQASSSSRRRTKLRGFDSDSEDDAPAVAKASLTPGLSRGVHRVNHILESEESDAEQDDLQASSPAKPQAAAKVC